MKSKVKEKTEINLFVFWGYDIFPYVLGGLASSMTEDGFAYVPAFQRSFKPFKILPPVAGAKIKDELRNLENEYRKETKTLHEKFMSKRNEIIKIEDK